MRSALALAALLAAHPAAAYGPATNYALHCQGCHLEDGTGLPGKIPSLAPGLARLAITPEGRAALLRIPGIANAPISDAELATLLDWTLHRFASDAAAASFTATEVERGRR
jgi:cytochrome c peroxidase